MKVFTSTALRASQRTNLPPMQAPRKGNLKWRPDAQAYRIFDRYNIVSKGGLANAAGRLDDCGQIKRSDCDSRRRV